VLTVSAALLVGASCATSTNSPTNQQTAASTGVDADAVPAPPLTLERAPLGVLVRQIGQEQHLNVVLMNGLEYYVAGPYELKKLSPAQLVEKIAADTGMMLSRLPQYDFIHPPGFESLAGFAPSKRLDRRMADIKTSIRIGADTPLYSALALLSHSLRVTLVADNVVAAALCGETNLQDVTLGDALDAILRSARLTDATCAVRDEDDAVLFHSPRAGLRETVFVNSPSTPRPAALDRRVSLYLPEPPEDPRKMLENSGAVPLADCAQTIGEQLGMRVEVDRNCQKLPVNPCVMIDVPVETAVRLIIQQWPLPHYGFTATEDTIRIVYLGPPAL
jgi:hypothetical protein